MTFTAILCYLLSVLVSVSAITAIIIFFKKTNRRFFTLHAIFGAVFFAIVITVMFVMMIQAFDEVRVMEVTAKMPAWAYKISVAAAFFVAVGLIRFALVNYLYHSREYFDRGTSFLVGYGLGGSIAMTIYCLFMTVHVSYQGIVSDLVTLDESLMRYSNGGVVSVFTPFWAHICFAAVLAIYAAIMLVIALFMEKHAKKRYKFRATLFMYIVTNGCELLMIGILLFATAKLTVVEMAVVFSIMVVLSALSLKTMYKYKEELPYTKQFDD